MVSYEQVVQRTPWQVIVGMTKWGVDYTFD